MPAAEARSLGSIHRGVFERFKQAIAVLDGLDAFEALSDLTILNADNIAAFGIRQAARARNHRNASRTNMDGQDVVDSGRSRAPRRRRLAVRDFRSFCQVVKPLHRVDRARRTRWLDRAAKQ